MSDQVLHLVAPGLLGPLSRLDDEVAGQRFPLIERWLARADRAAVSADAERLLFELFHVAAPGAGDLPTAALCYLADTGRAPEGVVYHATPVHLRPDQDRLLLFDSPAADLLADEAAEFVAAFDGHFGADGWRLEAPTPARWYLHVDGQPDLKTRPLGEVIGRNVDLFLPQGADAGTWRQRLNELQMLFHGLEVNQRREMAGRPAVNSLWFHGGGVLPTATGPGPSLQQPATPLLEGLARLTGESQGERLAWIGDAQRAVWDANPHAWLDAVRAVERRLSSQPEHTILYPGDGGAYRFAGAHRWRLWRRPRPLCESLLSESID